MLKIKNLRGECQHCNEPIEFHAEFTGTTADCPHCGQPTELMLAAPPEEVSPLRKKAIVFSILALLILAGGLGGSVIALKRVERLKTARVEMPAEAQPTPKPFDPFAEQGFRVSAVTLDKGPGSALVYAVGSVVNTSPRQRFGVKIEMELLDAAGTKVGSASDYQKVIEPGGEWKFRALVVEKRTVGVRVVGIKEDK